MMINNFNISTKIVDVYEICYSGNEAIRRSLQDPELRRCIYSEGSYYYTVCGTVFDLIQSIMVDIRDILQEKKIFRMDLKLAFNKSKEEMDNLISGIKAGIYELNCNSSKAEQDRAYQFWLDATDSSSSTLQAKVNRIESMMANFVKKNGKGGLDVPLVVKVCLVSTLLLYVKDRLYKEIMDVTQDVCRLDLRQVFSDGDCKRVYKQWEIVEKKLVWPFFTMDFSESPSVCKAFDSFTNLLQNYRLYKKAVKYSRSFLPDEERKKQEAYQRRERKREKKYHEDKMKAHDLSRNV